MSAHALVGIDIEDLVPQDSEDARDPQETDLNCEGLMSCSVISPKSISTRGSIGEEADFVRSDVEVKVRTISASKAAPEIRWRVHEDHERDFIRHMHRTELKEQTKPPLANHLITEQQRAKMLDWMIVVVNKAKSDVQTLFNAANLFDRYLRLSSERCAPCELHTLGVVALMLASKFEDVEPMDLPYVFRYVAHRQIPIKSLIKAEKEVFAVLRFSVTMPQEYDFLLLLLECKAIRHLLSKCESDVDDAINGLRVDAQFVALANLFNYTFCSYQQSLKADATLFFLLPSRVPIVQVVRGLCCM